MPKMVSVIALAIIFSGFFVLAYFGSFYVMLSDDIEFIRGRRALRRKRKKQEGFWRKFLFLDTKQYITKWHYFLFLCFLVSSPIALFFLVTYAITEYPTFRQLTIISGIPFLASICLSSAVRWNLYKGNIIRKRPTKRRP